MAIGSKELAPVELDTFEDARLTDELKKAKEELFNLRFQSATGQLESHGRIRAVKRDIARIHTIRRERELGIRATPVVEAKAPKKAEKAEKPAKSTTKKSEDAVEAPEADTETTEEAK
jgi:large subunit ribosomal protein L29